MQTCRIDRGNLEPTAASFARSAPVAHPKQSNNYIKSKWGERGKSEEPAQGILLHKEGKRLERAAGVLLQTA